MGALNWHVHGFFLRPVRAVLMLLFLGTLCLLESLRIQKNRLAFFSPMWLPNVSERLNGLTAWLFDGP